MVYGVIGPSVLGILVTRTMGSHVIAQFHAPFRTSYQYWELILTARRLLFLVLSLSINSTLHPTWKYTAQALVLVVSMMLHMRALPFAAVEDNICETASLCLLLLDLLAKLSAHSGGAPGADDSLRDASPLVLTLILNLLFVGYVIVRIAWDSALLRWLRKAVRPKGWTEPSGSRARPEVEENETRQLLSRNVLAGEA